MSRIGRLPVPIPSGVKVDIDGQLVTVQGPKGTLRHTVAEPIDVVREDVRFMLPKTIREAVAAGEGS